MIRDLVFRNTNMTPIKLEFYHNHIAKACLYSFGPLEPHFCIVRLGFAGVYVIFLILLKTWIVGARYNRLVEAVLTSTHNLCFEQKYEGCQGFFIWKISVFEGEIFYIFE